MTSVKKKENKIRSSDELNKPEDGEKKVFSGNKNIKGNRDYNIWNRRYFLFCAVVAFFLIGLSSYLFLKPKNEYIGTSIVKWFPVGANQYIKFEPFIIPFGEHGKFTYISLSISFELPNKELRDEMIEKNNWIRGIIYNILSENIYVLENVSSLMKLKKFIVNNVNNILTAGKVDNAIITDFSTV